MDGEKNGNYNSQISYCVALVRTEKESSLAIWALIA